jgi:hypothetical protein
VLAAAWYVVGPGLGAVARVRPAGLCDGLLQPPLASRRKRHHVLPALCQVAGRINRGAASRGWATGRAPPKCRDVRLMW